MDKNDPVLGFFHRWVEVFSSLYCNVTVICLEKGEVSLPLNVSVYSLGKEKGGSKIRYIYLFYKYIFSKRKEYNSVFIHMNQEYVLMGGIFWRIFGKKVTMWRNHHIGNLLTKISVYFCHKTFSTSKYSYIASSRKTMLMPVGIDTDMFKNVKESALKSVLFIARLSPIKKPDLLIEAIGKLKENGMDCSLSLYGPNLPKDDYYVTQLKERSLELGINAAFHPGVRNSESVKVFNEHEICVNLSPSGMYDKTIFESMSCERLSVSCNKNLIGQIDSRFLYEEGDLESLVECLKTLLILSTEEKKRHGTELRNLVINKHSLNLLSLKLKEVLG